MVGSGAHQEESMGSWRQDHFVYLKRWGDWEGSLHTIHTGRSQSQTRSHTFHEENARNMQLEIDHLKRKLCHEQRRRTPSNFDFSSDDEENGSYRPWLRTLPSEPFSYDKDYHHECKNRNSSSKGLGNDAMSRALNQISKSPFMPERDFLSGSLSLHSPCTMVEQILWS